MRKIISILLLILSFSHLPAKTTEETVRSTSVYYASASENLQQAKLKALMMAQAEAIDKVFGTHVQSYTSNLTNNKREEFLQISEAEIKGIWMKDLSAPVYEQGFWQEGIMVQCSVHGVVRKIDSAPIQCQCHVLCNGLAANNERTDFKSGDEFYMSFASPVDGYLTVYMLDSNNDSVLRLLPYYSQKDGAYEIKANQEYTFFSESHLNNQQEAQYVEGLIMETDYDMESDLIFVIFSPHKYSRAIDRAGADLQLRNLKYPEFLEWLAKCRRHDDDMVVKKILIDIQK